MMEIAGKTAFVTGAASGIGLGIATELSQAGVKVMLCDIEDAALVKAVHPSRTIPRRTSSRASRRSEADR